MQSITTNDFPMVMGVTIVGSLFILIANIVVDVTYAFLDPRVRYWTAVPERIPGERPRVSGIRVWRILARPELKEGEMADSYQMFINGEWVNSSDGQTRDVIDPATGEVIASVQEGTKEDADMAVAAAKAAFEGDWFDSTPKDRQLALLRLADRIEEHADELVQLEARTSASRSR